MTCIYLILNIFDRLFIDWYWVGHTKAWKIEGTEDLKPYIPKALIKSGSGRGGVSGWRRLRQWFGWLGGEIGT